MVNKLTIIGISILLILGIAALFFVGLQSTLSQINFAGATYQTTGGVTLEGDFLILKNGLSSSAAQTVNVQAKRDVTGVDELLVVGEASIFASSGFGANAGSALSVRIEGSEGGVVEATIASLGTGSDESKSISTAFPAKLVKLKNNFDGTWSTLEHLGVGDIFITKDTKLIEGNPILVLQATSSARDGGTTSIHGTIYNIVIKESGFAICKIDSYPSDLNGDGIIDPDTECLDIATIVLNSEEAIRESFNEKLARIEQELLDKNSGLQNKIDSLIEQLEQRLAEGQITQTEIDALQQQIIDLGIELQKQPDNIQLQQQLDELKQQDLVGKINALKKELELTKKRLDSVQDKNKEVVAVIETQEIFKEPKELQIGLIISITIGIILIILLIILIIIKKR